MIFNKDMLTLYAITDRRYNDKLSLYKQVEEALKGGVTIVQLREKELDEDTFTQEALQLKELCHRYNVPLVINDNLTVALRSGADGIHVGLNDMPIDEIRRRTGRDFIIGATAKTVSQAQTAQSMGADYLGVGAVFPSSTKTDAVRITKERLNEISESVSIPIVAIGGITADNAIKLSGSRISGIAVVSSLFGADDIMSTAEVLKKTAERLTGNENF